MAAHLDLQILLINSYIFCVDYNLEFACYLIIILIDFVLIFLLVQQPPKATTVHYNKGLNKITSQILAHL